MPVVKGARTRLRQVNRRSQEIPEVTLICLQIKATKGVHVKANGGVIAQNGHWFAH